MTQIARIDPALCLTAQNFGGGSVIEGLPIVVPRLWNTFAPGNLAVLKEYITMATPAFVEAPGKKSCKNPAMMYYLMQCRHGWGTHGAWAVGRPAAMAIVLKEDSCLPCVKYSIQLAF